MKTPKISIIAWWLQIQEEIINASIKSALRMVTLCAAVAMLFPLPIMQYIGEEGLYAIKSYEMFFRQDYFHPSILGMVWPHSPVFHWPVIAICKLIGWEHVDIAIRLVSVSATWLSAGVAFLLARHLFPERSEAGWLAAAIYLTMGEVSFWYGWLGYVDASFGCLIFAAIATLWLAIEKKSPAWLILSVLCISGAFLVKNITAYALYGLAGAVLVYRMRRWDVLIRPGFLIPAILTLLVPVAYNILVLHSSANAMATVRDALRNFQGYGLVDYLLHWLGYPFVFLFRALPLSLWIAWLWARRRFSFSLDNNIKTLILVVLACFFPFWVSAAATPRYLVPIYGLVAVLLTGLCLQLDLRFFRRAISILVVFALLKIPYSFGILPYIKDWRPERDVKAVATEIMQLTDKAPLYSRNDVATGLAIAAYIDVWRQDRPPISWFREKNSHENAFVLAEAEDPSLGRLVKVWRLRGDLVYLYWHPGG